MNIKIAKYGSKEQKGLIELRRETLRLPLGLDFTEEELANEKDQIHLVALENNHVVGGLLLVEKKSSYKLRQMCVSPKHQGKNIGSQLLDYAFQLAKENNISSIYCHARKTAINFYFKNGFKVVGEEFEEVGIGHFRMEKIV